MPHREGHEEVRVIRDAYQEYMTLTREEAEKIAKEAAHTAVAETLTALGMDTSDPFELQRDFAHLRSWRRSVEKVREKSLLTAVGIITAGVIGLIVVFFRGTAH